MGKATWTCAWIAGILVLAAVAGCGGGDDRENEAERPVDGTFVGKVAQTRALVAVVVPPAARGEDRRDVTVYVSDGRRLSEGFSGAATGNEFTVTSDGGGEAKGKLSGNSATGTIELPDDKTGRFQASRATAAAGLYNLMVSGDGKLRGASAAGVGLTGSVAVRKRGTGKLKLADGTRHEFDVTGSTAGDVSLNAGEVRLIVLPGGEMRGAGKSRRPAKDFFIVSSAK